MASFHVRDTQRGGWIPRWMSRNRVAPSPRLTSAKIQSKQQAALKNLHKIRRDDRNRTLDTLQVLRQARLVYDQNDRKYQQSMKKTRATMQAAQQQIDEMNKVLRMGTIHDVDHTMELQELREKRVKRMQAMASRRAINSPSRNSSLVRPARSSTLVGTRNLLPSISPHSYKSQSFFPGSQVQRKPQTSRTNTTYH